MIGHLFCRDHWPAACVCELGTMIGHERACAAKILDPVWSCTCSTRVCADTHHVAESTLRPPDKSEALARLDALNDDEMRVLHRVIDRLDFIRRHSEPAGTLSALHEALLLELTDIRLEREAGQYRLEAPVLEVEPECPHPFGHKWMVRGPITECRLCGLPAASFESPTDADMIGAPDAEIVDGAVLGGEG